MKFLRYFLILPFFLCGSATYAADFDTDFENGLAQWSIERPPGYAQGSIDVQDVNVKEGKQALRLAATEKNSIARITSAHIPLTENRNIAFQGWYRFAGEESAMEIRFRSIDANGTIMEPWQDYFQFHRLEPAKDWTHFSIPLSIHAAAQSIDITITYSGGAGKPISIISKFSR